MNNLKISITRQVYNLFQEPVEQPPLGFSIAEEKNRTVLKSKQVKKLAAPWAPSNLLPNMLPNLSPDLLPNIQDWWGLQILNVERQTLNDKRFQKKPFAFCRKKIEFYVKNHQNVLAVS